MSLVSSRSQIFPAPSSKPLLSEGCTMLSLTSVLDTDLLWPVGRKWKWTACHLSRSCKSLCVICHVATCSPCAWRPGMLLWGAVPSAKLPERWGCGAQPLTIGKRQVTRARISPYFELLRFSSRMSRYNNLASIHWYHDSYRYFIMNIMKSCFQRSFY